MLSWIWDRSRKLIHFTGADAVTYLQGLTTQDMGQLSPERWIYTHILTPQGRYDGEVFLTPYEEGVMADFPAEVWERMSPRLQLLKLRQDVVFHERSDLALLINVLEDGGVPALPHRPRYCFEDPRLSTLGLRHVCPEVKIPMGTTHHLMHYHKLLLKLGIPVHERGLTPGKTISLEAGLQDLNGISFTKGCYMGQELMSRVHHQGLIRKRIFPIILEKEVPVGEKILDDQGENAGEILLSEGTLGLARLKLDAVKAYLKNKGDLKVSETPLHFEVPSWMKVIF